MLGKMNNEKEQKQEKIRTSAFTIHKTEKYP